jgi:hypothetical protein
VYQTDSAREVWPDPALTGAKVKENICNESMLATVSLLLIKSAIGKGRTKEQVVAIPDVISLHRHIFGDVLSGENIQGESVLGLVRR